MTGKGSLLPFGRTMRIATWPFGPPGIVRSSMSAGSFVIDYVLEMCKGRPTIRDWNLVDCRVAAAIEGFKKRSGGRLDRLAQWRHHFFHSPSLEPNAQSPRADSSDRALSRGSMSRDCALQGTYDRPYMALVPHLMRSRNTLIQDCCRSHVRRCERQAHANKLI